MVDNAPFAAPGAQSQPTLFSSPFFRLEQVADGAYAAIATDENWALGNAGIIDLGDQTLIFDTFGSPRAAQDLCAAAEQLTRRPAAWVVNSHWHGDHFLGNQVFVPHAHIIATPRTRTLISQCSTMLDSAPQRLPEAIRQTQERAANETDPAQRQKLMAEAERLAVQLEILATLQLTPPQLTFDSQFVVHGSRRTAVLMTFGEGQTASDIVLHLPEEGIVFAGDLIVVQGHPWMGDGNPDHWLSVLSQLEALNPRTIVPGHGPVSTIEAISSHRSYLQDIVRLVQEGVRAGMSKAQIEAIAIPTPYANWDGSKVFGWNMSALFDKMSSVSAV